MGIIWACIAPHGAEAILELAGDAAEDFAETRKAMIKMGAEVKRQHPETIVLATPHNLRLQGTIGVITTEFSEGSLEANGNKIGLHCECDRTLARLIAEDARKESLPVVGVDYAAADGPASCVPMDWGTLIPLWFLTDAGKNCRIVMLTPSREIPLQNLVDFGKVVAGSAERLGRRVVFVASADQGHAHKADGPYGFNSASKQYDERVIEAIKANNLKMLLSLPSEFVDEAKPDSLWQIAMLQGVLETIPMKSELLSYQAPTYFGLLCAVFRALQP
jgi:aromatic ring-opening dioxygenase LigB subunit